MQKKRVQKKESGESNLRRICFTICKEGISTTEREEEGDDGARTVDFPLSPAPSRSALVVMLCRRKKDVNSRFFASLLLGVRMGTVPRWDRATARGLENGVSVRCRLNSVSTDADAEREEGEEGEKREHVRRFPPRTLQLVLDSL